MQLKSTNIYYGGFTIPVRIGNHHKSEGNNSLFKMACPKCEDGGTMAQKYICEDCDDSVLYTKKDLRQKADIGEDNPKIFDQEQVRELDSESIIEIISVKPKSVIDIRKITGSYVVYPGTATTKKKTKVSTTAKPWAVLKEGLQQTDKCILVKFVNNGKERVGYLTMIGDEMELICTTFATNFQEADIEKPNIQLAPEEIKSGVSMLTGKLSENELSEEDVVDARKERQLELIANGEAVETVKGAENEMAFFAQ